MRTCLTALTGAALSLMVTTAAWGFDYAAYRAADLDHIIAQKRPGTGAYIIPGEPYRLTVTLTAYAAPCDATFLKRTMVMTGFRKAQMDALRVTGCVTVRSAKGEEQSIFVQDEVAAFLPKEVPLDSKLTLYVIHMYTDPGGPGLLINEFSTGDAAPAAQADPPPTGKTQAAAADPVPLSSDQPQKQAETRASKFRGLWARSGAGFGCMVAVAADGEVTREETKSKAFAMACQRIGPFVIGGEAKTLTTVLGAPHRKLPQPDGATAMVYFLDGPERPPYLAATVRKNSIITLQVTGPAPAAGKDFSFNLVNLGDGTDTLIKYFGPAKQVKPSEIKNTNIWSYAPWPFSFEVTDGHVTSIKIMEFDYRKGGPAPQVIWTRESAASGQKTPATGPAQETPAGSAGSRP